MARMLTSRARANERALDTDVALLARLREGDRSVIGELFERHRGAARATVIALAGHSADADAIVNEAFTSLFEAVDRGAGPTEAFRPYLLQCVRHAVYAEANRAKREAPTDTIPDRPSLRDHTGRIDEDAVVAAALAELPDRWQAVLWMLEVEGRTTAEVAEVLDLRPNAVAALAYRAREGLKESYLAHHLEPAPERDCREVSPLLGSYVRDTLRTRDTARVETHLESCEHCSAALVELRQLDAQLGRRLAVVFPFGAAATAATATVAAAGAGAVGSLVSLPLRWVAGRWKQVTFGGAAAGVVVAAVAVAASGGGDTTEAASLPVVTSTVAAPTTQVATTMTSVPATTEPAPSTTSAPPTVPPTTAPAPPASEPPVPPATAARPRPTPAPAPRPVIVVPPATEPTTTTEATTTTEPAPTTTTAPATTTTVVIAPPTTVPETTTTSTIPPLAAQASVSSQGGRPVVVVSVTGGNGPIRLHMRVSGDLIPGRMRGDGWVCNDGHCDAVPGVGPLEVWTTPVAGGTAGTMRIRVLDSVSEVVLEIPISLT